MFRRSNKFKKIGYEYLDKRYEGDIFQYNAGIHSFRRFDDVDYAEFVLDKYKREAQYASITEVYRGAKRFRYEYPFHKMYGIKEVLGIEKEFNIVPLEIQDTYLVSTTWKDESLARLFHKIKKKKEKSFIYEEGHHAAYYHKGLNITCANDGIHSKAMGIALGKGTLYAYEIDVTKLYKYINSNGNLSFSWDMEKVLKDFNINSEIVKLMESVRYYGTDYRLMLIYEISKRMHLKD